jgi:hypothetical protein
LVYGLGALFTAVGVGKVGAYANYFLELYVALLWLAGRAMRHAIMAHTSRRSLWGGALAGLLLLSCTRYSPVWSGDQLRLAGIVAPNPPRLAFGRSGLWAEVIREHAVLAAMARVQGAISAEIRATGGPIFTDMPGIAAQANALTPFQVFEHRQLLDGGRWDQRPVLQDLANGRLPLVVLDYLGNWITPEMIALLRHRYGNDGSLGTFDLYRPVACGPLYPLEGQIGGLRLVGYRLAAPLGGPAYAPGALLPLMLEFQRLDVPPPTGIPDVLVRLQPSGGAALESSLPLLYGAFPPADWPTQEPVQHLQPIVLPETLPPGDYALSVTLRQGGQDLAEPVALGRITVAPDGGRSFGNYYVPGPLLQTWEEMGAEERVGLPLMPAVPFDWGTLQCFERVCLEERGGVVAQRPLGDLLYLAETIRSDAAPPVGPLRELRDRWGGDTILGPARSGAVQRNGLLVQWTQYARLELAPDGALSLGRLGDDTLRLPPGTPYRWP